MELLVFRTGKGAKSWQGPPDDRPLRKKAKRQAQKIGAWLAQNRLRPGKTLVAPGERARVSAEKALKAGGWSAQDIADLPEPDKLPDLPDIDTLLAVLPGKAAAALLRSLGVEAELAPGTLIQVSLASGGATFRAAIKADNLPDRFPYPAPDGPYRRDRPAYYYMQSAVIPYRRQDRDIEILLVSSSSGRHWVVPKGIHEPGLSAPASAAEEAREEAGVLGHPDDYPVGQYSYPKWGATCTVTVFPMEVTKVIPASEWEESHRARKWVSIEDAAALLAQDGLRSMVRAVGQL